MDVLALLLLAVPVSAQRIEAPEASAASSAGSAAGAAVTAVPAMIEAPALAPAGPSASLPAAAEAPAAAAPAALPTSAIAVLDPSSLPPAGKDYTGAEWAKLADSVPDGSRAVLRSMRNGSSARLSLTMADGETLTGSFLGVAGDKMAFRSGGKLLGVDLRSPDILKVERLADVWFDGGTLRPEEVVVHAQPAAVNDPFKDLAAYKGRTLEIDARDHGDAKRWTAQTVTGRLVKADGNEIEAVRERIPHYDSKHQVPHLAAVNGVLIPGTPVEVELLKRPSAKGLFRGVREDADGACVLLEVPDSDGSTTLRAYRDALSIKTQGYKAGALMDASIRLY